MDDPKHCCAYARTQETMTETRYRNIKGVLFSVRIHWIPIEARQNQVGLKGRHITIWIYILLYLFIYFCNNRWGILDSPTCTHTCKRTQRKKWLAARPSLDSSWPGNNLEPLADCVHVGLSVCVWVCVCACARVNAQLFSSFNPDWYSAAWLDLFSRHCLHNSIWNWHFLFLPL